MNGIAEGKGFVEIGSDEKDGGAAVGGGAQFVVNEPGRFDVEAARRLGGDDDLRLPLQLAGQDDFLLVASGERAGTLHRRLRTDVESLDERGCSLRRFAGPPARLGQCDVLGNGHLGNQPVARAVLGDVRDMSAEGIAQRRRQLGLPVARHADDGHDLASMNVDTGDT